MSHPWTLIRNPRSASGKGQKQWPRIESLLQAQGIDYEVLVTESPAHAIELAREAVLKGARKLCAVGGDGTVNEVINGLFSQDEVPASEVLVAQIPIGTGNDWCRTMNIPTKHEAAVALLKEGKEVVQDVGVVQWKGGEEEKQRHFVNIGGMGYQAFVGIVANERKARGKGGIFGYVSALLSCLVKFHAMDVSLEMGDQKVPETKVFSMAVGICKYNGGGMKQCPEAIIDDGQFDITIINDLPKFKVVRNVPNLFNGSFIRKNKEVETYRSPELKVNAPAGWLLEVDGENIGEGSATFSIKPKALRVRCEG